MGSKGDRPTTRFARASSPRSNASSWSVGGFGPGRRRRWRSSTSSRAPITPIAATRPWASKAPSTSRAGTRPPLENLSHQLSTEAAQLQVCRRQVCNSCSADELLWQPKTRPLSGGLFLVVQGAWTLGGECASLRVVSIPFDALQLKPTPLSGGFLCSADKRGSTRPLLCRKANYWLT